MENGADFNNAKIKDDIKLTAKFTPKAFNVELDVNGGAFENTNTDKKMVVKYDSNIVLPKVITSEVGKVFDHWETSSGVVVNNNEICKFSQNEKLTAMWEYSKASVRYNLNGGSFNDGSNLPSIFTYGENYDLTTFKTPSKVGYTFMGWFKEGETEKTTSITWESMDKAFELNAKWEANKSSVTLINKLKPEELDEGNGYDSFSVIFDDNKIYDSENVERSPKANPEREGYIFNGWKDSQGDSVYNNYEIWKIDKAEVKLYAIWTPVETTVTFKDGNEVVKTENINYETILNDFDSLEKVGYTFDGWFNGEETEPTTEIKNNLSNVILTAKWTAKTTNVKYKTNEGVFSDSTTEKTVSATYDAEFILLEEVPTRFGYTFDGWFNGETKQEDVAKWNQNFETVILTAKWSPKEIKFTYNANNGTFADNKDKKEALINFGDSFTLISEIPVRVGYKFIGWFNGETEQENVAKWNQDENVTLIAKWEIKQITFTFTAISKDFEETSISAITEDVQKTVDYNAKLLANVPTVDNEKTVDGKTYSFVGWFDADGNKWTADSLVNIEDDITLTAKWKITKYTFTSITIGNFENIIEQLDDVVEITLPDTINNESLFKNCAMPSTLSRIKKGSETWNVSVVNGNVIFNGIA